MPSARSSSAVPASRLVRYPGRFGSGFGVPAPSFEALVTACAAQLEGGTVLFGHSFGAYLAYASAVRRPDAVALLVVAGAPAPARMVVPAVGDPGAAARYLDDVDPGMLAEAPSDEWREIVAETAIQDLRLLAGFDPAGYPPVRCPIVAVRGRGDPLTADATLAEWSTCTRAGFAGHTVPGGHSDYLRTPPFARWLRRAAVPARGGDGGTPA